MKITITLNEEEHTTIMNISRSVTNSNEKIEIKDEHYVGNFGEVKYDYKKNEMVFDLKTGFIAAMSNLVVIAANMIKQFMSTCEMFDAAWFGDVKNITDEEPKNFGCITSGDACTSKE